MDLSELPANRPRPGAREVTSPDPGAGHEWRELVAQLGRESATPLTTALERVNAFATTGKIDRAGLRSIREAIDRARRIAIIAQQISRFASGRVRPSQERLDLTQAVRDALTQRARDTQNRGIELRQELAQADVLVDATMLSALLQALLDWSFEHARSHIVFRLQVKSWPEHALLSCSFAHLPPDQVIAGGPGATGQPDETGAHKLDTMPWQLLRRLVQPMGLLLQRDDHAGNTQLSLEFPRTVGRQLISLSGFDEDDEPASGFNSQPMAGSHVLVIAARRETRNAVRETLRPMGLMVDYVASTEEAREFCRNGLPHAVVYEAALAGGIFQKLRLEWAAEAPRLAFVEISEEGRGLAVTDVGGVRTSHIGRGAIMSTLTNALTAELALAA